jgi:hypothetical protein
MTHKEILTDSQIKLLPVLKLFSDRFALVGGTAIALQIGHRRSIDFDMFIGKRFNNLAVEKKFRASAEIDKIIVSRLDELTFLAQGVKFTFFNYPYAIGYPLIFDSSIKMPDLLTLAAMKAFALGMRAKWKDYVDLYFIMRDFHGISEIIKKGEEIFAGEFNAKIFRVQLGYFADVRYDEKIEFIPGFEVPDEEIKQALTEHSLER